MPTYKELIEQRAALDLQIGQARERELDDAIAQVKALIANYDLTPKDIFPKNSGKRATEGSRVQPKYRNPVTGDTWTGRGKAPKWIKNAERQQFLIHK